MEQMSLAHTGCELATKRKREFLDEMNLVVPWAALLHGQKEVVFADSGHRGVHKGEEVKAQHPAVVWQIAMMPGQRKAMDKSKPINALKEQLDKVKARIRAKVEHPCRVIKSQFGHRKTRYRRGAGQEQQPVAGDVRHVQPVDGAQANIARGAGMSAPTAREQAESSPKRGLVMTNSALVRSCEHSRINSRCGGGYADLS